MDSENLYDSLDEEFASTSSLNAPGFEEKNSKVLNSENVAEVDSDQTITEESLNQHSRKSSIPTIKQRCIVMSSREIQENLDISSIVPLYSGDKYKSEIGPSKKSSSIPLMSNKRSSYCQSSKDDNLTNNYLNRSKRRSRFTQGSCTNIDAIVQGNSAKSYFSMFHSRMGLSGSLKAKEAEDTSRAFFGDSQRSVISDTASGKEEYLDAEDDRSDTTSFYFNQIEEDKANSSLYTEDRHTFLRNKSPQLRSITDICLTPKIDNGMRNRKKPFVKKTQVAPIPTLGSLGPDRTAIQEKMERRKKQLLYGQKASNRNRIKMVELNVLKNLKNEMQNSSLVDVNHKSLET